MTREGQSWGRDLPGHQAVLALPQALAGVLASSHRCWGRSQGTSCDSLAGGCARPWGRLRLSPPCPTRGLEQLGDISLESLGAQRYPAPQRDAGRTPGSHIPTAGVAAGVARPAASPSPPQLLPGPREEGPRGANRGGGRQPSVWEPGVCRLSRPRHATLRLETAE